MSGVEIALGVVGAVAALPGAYRSGLKIYDRVQKRRAEKGLTKNAHGGALLEKALKDGQADIERLIDEGANVQVDDQAERALQRIIIEAQAAILEDLAKAVEDDSITDFSPIAEKVRRTRRQAVNVLNDLYTRMEERQSPRQTLDMYPPPPPPPKSRRQTLEDPETKTKRWWRRGSDDAKRSPTSSEITPQSPVSRQSTALCSPTLPKRTDTSPTLSRPESVFSRRSTITFSPPVNRNVVPISKSNSYAGFCQGAHYAQLGPSHLKKAIQYSIKTYDGAYHCTKCHFSLPPDVRLPTGPRFDDRVYKIPEIDGLMFRFLWLFKSHLEQKKNSSRRYGCMICALTSGKPSRSFAGEGHFFEHLWGHRGETLGVVVVAGSLEVEAYGLRRKQREIVTDEGELSGKKEDWEGFDLLYLFDGEEWDGRRRAESFLLPPPVMEVDGEEGGAGQEVHGMEVISLPGDVFRNVWAEEGRK